MPDSYDIKDKYGFKVGEVRRQPDFEGAAVGAAGGIVWFLIFGVFMLAGWLLVTLIRNPVILLVAGIGVAGLFGLAWLTHFEATQAAAFAASTRQLSSVAAADQGVDYQNSPWENVYQLKEMSSGRRIVVFDTQVYVDRDGNRINEPHPLQLAIWQVIDRVTWKGILLNSPYWRPDTQELALVPVDDQGIDADHAVGPVSPLKKLSTGSQIVEHQRPVYVSSATGERVMGIHPLRLTLWKLTDPFRPWLPLAGLLGVVTAAWVGVDVMRITRGSFGGDSLPRRAWIARGVARSMVAAPMLALFWYGR